jgi:hypothetical protein
MLLLLGCCWLQLLLCSLNCRAMAGWVSGRPPGCLAGQLSVWLALWQASFLDGWPAGRPAAVSAAEAQTGHGKVCRDPGSGVFLLRMWHCRPFWSIS